MKAIKRNAVIITVLLFVAAAVYLNWSYSRGEGQADTQTVAEDGALEKEAGLTEDENVEKAGLYFTDGEEGEKTALTADANETEATDSSEFFAKARLDRTASRDEAKETLKVITETEGASQEVIDNALSDMSAIAAWTEKEAELESLITAKGFSDCVVYMSDDGIKVTVASPQEGMSAAAAARITDIITSETGCSVSDINIVEVGK